MTIIKMGGHYVEVKPEVEAEIKKDAEMRLNDQGVKEPTLKD